MTRGSTQSLSDLICEALCLFKRWQGWVSARGSYAIPKSGADLKWGSGKKSLDQSGKHRSAVERGEEAELEHSRAADFWPVVLVCISVPPEIRGSSQGLYNLACGALCELKSPQS